VTEERRLNPHPPTAVRTGMVWVRTRQETKRLNPERVRNGRTGLRVGCLRVLQRAPSLVEYDFKHA
jgi:hypothetical protein